MGDRSSLLDLAVSRATSGRFSMCRVSLTGGRSVRLDAPTLTPGLGRVPMSGAKVSCSGRAVLLVRNRWNQGIGGIPGGKESRCDPTPSDQSVCVTYDICTYRAVFDNVAGLCKCAETGVLHRMCYLCRLRVCINS